MSRLRTLRWQLATLRRWRKWARWTTAWTAAVYVLLWVLAALFLIDVVFELPVDQRVVLVLLGGGVFVWAAAKLAYPFLGIEESIEEMALLVESQQKIDSDLIAALEFEEPDADQWGSRQLENAVIEYVAQLGRGFNVFLGFDRSTAAKRLGILLISGLAATGVVALAPQHALVFLKRLALSKEHYPTKTKIVAIEINGNSVDVRPGMAQTVRIGYGQSLDFVVQAAGEVPEGGRIEFRAATTGDKEPIALTKSDANAEEAAGFEGSLPRLLGTVRYQVYLGDAWTDPAEIEVIPLPVVEPKFRTILPAYARSSEDSRAETTSLQHYVIEGSQLKVAIESSKSLEKATLKIVDPLQADDDADEMNPTEFELKCVEGERQRWTLADSNSPFALVTAPFRFQIQVVDEDGLSLEVPLTGNVGLKADRKPRVSGSLVHDVVLPTARPVVSVRAYDDFGVSGLKLNMQIMRQRNASLDPDEADNAIEEVSLDMTEFLTPAAPAKDFSEGPPPPRDPVAIDFPIRRDTLPLSGDYRLDLRPYNLKKGDQIKLTLEVADYRGESESRATPSEPFVLEISNQSGVLAAVQQPDEDTERRLTDIQRIHLGIGESQ